MKKNIAFLCLVTILTLSNSLLGEHYNPFSRKNREQKHLDKAQLYNQERKTATNPHERAEIERKMAHQEYKARRLSHKIEAKERGR